MNLQLSKLRLLLILFSFLIGTGFIFSQCPGYNVSAGNGHSSNPVCPWGFPTLLVSQLENNGTPLGGATYTWQPGNIQQQQPTVNPSVTTTYTVYATHGGCTYSNTTTVLVMNVTMPTISYVITAFSPTSTVNFPVTQNGVSGGIYSIAPTNALVTININTGLITASGNCFGTYTVTYATQPFNQDGGVCENYYATTIIRLRDLNCPISLTNTSFTLCPKDKVIFQTSIQFSSQDGVIEDGEGGTGGGGVGQHDSHSGNVISWLPSAGNSTSGINCNACMNPTFTFGSYPSGTSFPIIYTITAMQEGQVCGTKTISIYKNEFCQEDEIIGCCFSNYGAAVSVNDANTYLNIYCNLVNELGNTPSSNPPLQKGEFKNNDGTVRVLLDWIHNAKNELYVTYQGTTSVFGTDQKIKGNSSTHFNEFWLEGNGTKSIWIDEFGHANLDLTSNILSLQNFVYALKNSGGNVIRTSGYASDDVHGYFSWSIENAAGTLANKKYLYPLGSPANSNEPFRYRPIVIINNSTVNDDEISTNFMNIAPSTSVDAAFVNTNTLLTNIVTNQAPNVLQLNNDYYHKIKNTSPTNTITSNVSIKSYYFSSDGSFQSMAQWEKDPSQPLDWWGSTPGANASNTPTTDPGTPGMIYAMTTGTQSFNHTPFILSKGGFYLNTNNFGNVGNGSGTNFSISSSPLSGANTPTGGGVNGSFGTGSSSGNNGTGGNTIFTPSPVSGEYVMTISPANPCAVGGKIRFVIDQNGNISASSVKYGINPGVYLGELSESIYTIDNQNTGITFSSTPNDLIKSCVNSITVTTTTNNDHILLSTTSESISISLPSVGNGSNTITYGQFKIFNKANVQVYNSSALSSGTTAFSPNPPLLADIYRFELSVTASTMPPLSEIITGQIIVK